MYARVGSGSEGVRREVKAERAGRRAGMKGRRRGDFTERGRENSLIGRTPVDDGLGAI